MLISLKVATPPTAATVKVPARAAAPALGSVPKASVTFDVSVVTKLLEASLNSTVISGLIVISFPASVG